MSGLLPRIQRVVGIGEMLVSRDPSEMLVTHSLGSCVGVTLFDPVVRAGGMLHAMLPVSRLDPAKAALAPCMFADTGVNLLLQALFDLGATRRNLLACMAGAACLMDHDDVFRIGERNQMIVRKLLWKNEILLAGEDVGGAVTRTMYLDMGSGDTLLKAFGKTWVLGSEHREG